MRRRFARELAKAVFCGRGAPCGSCPSCQSVDHGNHPGVHTYGVGKEKGSVEIGEIRELAAKIHLRRSSFLVGIVEDADRMTVPAANALLKTLEEPTGTALLILVARSSGVVLPTIVSRCHRVLFPAPPPAGARGEAERDVAAEVAAAVARVDFLAEHDTREWLLGLFPGAESSREAARRLIEALLAAEREGWRPPPAAVLSGARTAGADAAAARLEELLGLHADLERNVHPDLVLEGVLRLARGGR